MEELKIITLDDGAQVEVTTEVYQEYYRPQWREEKCKQRDAKRLLSSDYEYGSGDGDTTTMQDYMADPKPSPEELYIRNEENKLLQEALSILSEEKRALIEALYYEDKSERDIAAETGVALEEMREYMKKHQ